MRAHTHARTRTRYMYTHEHILSIRLRPCRPQEDNVTFPCDLGNPTLNWNLRCAAQNATWADAPQGQRKLDCVSLSIHPEEAPLHLSQQTNSQRAAVGSYFMYLTFVGRGKQACHICWLERFHPGHLPSQMHRRGSITGNLGTELQPAVMDSGRAVGARYAALVGQRCTETKSQLCPILKAQWPLSGVNIALLLWRSQEN